MVFSRHRSPTATAPPSPSVLRRPFLRKSSAQPQQQSPPDKDVELLKNKENSSKNAQSNEPVEETPLTATATRFRLDTEDTLRMSNLNLPDLLLDEDNPFLECHDQYSPEAVQKAKAKRRSSRNKNKAREEEEEQVVVDCASTLSSLSAGSFKQRPPPVTQQQQQQQQSPQQQRQHQARPIVPPKVICFRVETKVPDWLLEDDDDASLHPNRYSSLELDQSTSFLTNDDDNTAENRQPQAQSHSSPVRTRRPLPQQWVPRTPCPQQPQHHQHRLQPVWTGLPSPVNPRPTMGRYKSVSCRSLFPARTPQAQSHGVTPPFPLTPRSHPHPDHNQALLLTPRTLPPPVSTSVAIPTTGTTTKTPKHKRTVSAGEASLLESLWTAPTAASSSHSVLLLVDTGPADAKRSSAIVQELRTLWTKVVARGGASPPDLVLLDSIDGGNVPALPVLSQKPWNPAQGGCLT